MKKQKGFTLIELLVVIAIIGILATIVMVSLNTARGKARDARRVSDVRQIQLALQMYYDTAGSYPTTIQGLAILKPTYISAVPLDPDGNTNYPYCSPGSAAYPYHLGTKALEATPSNTGPLSTDADVITDGCGSGPFSGADPVYDVIP
ncbi:MAG: general secretion pathway protein G [Parcubacteria group bacterium LiPW_39]|nr:MAG: general secretion pathway protein G [Parcubacteria group bacterium LiPW_39]